MRDWDRIVMILIGGAIAVYTGYRGWQMRRAANPKGAIGALLLAAATVAVPIALAIVGD